MKLLWASKLFQIAKIRVELQYHAKR